MQAVRVDTLDDPRSMIAKLFDPTVDPTLRQRRGRNHETGRDECLVCTRCGGRGDGRGHPQGQEEDPAASVFLQGEYGVRDLFVGVPVKLGARGMEQIIQIKLTPDEDAALKKSAAAVKELVDVIGM